MMTASNIHYEPAQRTRGLSAGGIGAIFLLAQRVGLIQEIDHKLHLLKRHLPYHESDHVLNIAFNILAGGLCLEHLELRATTRSTSMPWEPSASPTPPRLATSAAVSPRTTS